VKMHLLLLLLLLQLAAPGSCALAEERRAPTQYHEK
jgi:hypothetical protein